MPPAPVNTTRRTIQRNPQTGSPADPKEYKKWALAMVNNPATTRMYNYQVTGGVILLFALSGWITYMAAF
ncbi:hypothetical protein M231_08002 [Tremella mesenterica]|uniref:Uncharacterized protein n=1 Tax=Tremella mesenterica TaxID=5217 RepID=A0A4Q1BF77_TREME|nr:hypothetical protein M231_08002 [Tremella mesenterica]